MNDAQTLSMLLGGGRKTKAKRKPSHKFAIGMKVVYCHCPATIVGKEGRVWQVECDGKIWPSNGKDMKPEAAA